MTDPCLSLFTALYYRRPASHNDVFLVVVVKDRRDPVRRTYNLNPIGQRHLVVCDTMGFGGCKSRRKGSKVQDNQINHVYVERSSMESEENDSTTIRALVWRNESSPT